MRLPDVTDIDVRIGEAIRAARLHIGAKQEDLAAAIGLDRSTLSRYEAGTRSVPIEVLLHIAYVVRAPLSELVPGVREMETAWAVPSSTQAGEHDVIGQVLALRPDLTPQVLEFITLLTEGDTLTEGDV